MKWIVIQHDGWLLRMNTETGDTWVLGTHASQWHRVADEEKGRSVWAWAAEEVAKDTTHE